MVLSLFHSISFSHILQSSIKYSPSHTDEISKVRDNFASFKNVENMETLAIHFQTILDCIVPPL